MEILTVPAPVRGKLGSEATDGLVTMFADAHRLATESFERALRDGDGRFERRIAEVSERFDRRLAEELAKFRIEMIERMSDLRFDLLKWNFLFWIGQVAVLVSVLSWMLRGVR